MVLVISYYVMHLYFTVGLIFIANHWRYYFYSATGFYWTHVWPVAVVVFCDELWGSAVTWWCHIM